MRIEIKKNSLIFREEAKSLEKLAKKKLKQSDSVSLDFSNLKFFSRSFADELLNVLARQKSIKIVNLPLHLEKFLKIVKKTKKDISG